MAEHMTWGAQSQIDRECDIEAASEWAEARAAEEVPAHFVAEAISGTLHETIPFPSGWNGVSHENWAFVLSEFQYNSNRCGNSQPGEGHEDEAQLIVGLCAAGKFQEAQLRALAFLQAAGKWHFEQYPEFHAERHMADAEAEEGAWL
jgi:hypothetical protein